MRRLLLLGAAVAAASVTAMPVPAAAQEQGDVAVTAVDISDYPTVDLTITAPAGLAARDLPADAFSVTEGGATRDAQVTRIAGEALQVVLVIDTSGSMRGAPLDAAKAAALGFVDALPANTAVSVVSFGDTPSVLTALSPDVDAVHAAISSLQASGETALYDGVAAGVAVFGSAPPANRSLVVLSDGGDTQSTASLDDVAALLEAGGLRAAVVELVTSESDAGPLARLAAAGHGRVVSATDPGALAGLYDGLATEVVNQYVVSFRSESRGSTIVTVTVDHEGVRGSTTETLALPKATAVTPTTAAAPKPNPVTIAAAPPVWAESWVLAVGAATMFVAIALVAFALLHRPGPERRLAREYGIEGGGGGGSARWVTDASGRVAGGVQRVIDRAGGLAPVDKTLEQAGLSIRSGEAVTMIAAVAVVGGALGYLYGSPLFALAGVAIPVLVGVLVLRAMANRRRALFADQLPDTLLLLASSLRAGYGLLQAIDAAAREAAAPTSDELGRVVIETRLGRNADDALAATATRMGSVDFEWVVQAIMIHRQAGGDLAELLDHVAETIRGRVRVQRQVRALSAEGRMSAIVLVALPFVMAVLISSANPDYLAPLWEETAGRVMLAVAAGLLVAGGLWLRRIVRPEY
jgi:tight adherence protein B